MIRTIPALKGHNADSLLCAQRTASRVFIESLRAERRSHPDDARFTWPDPGCSRQQKGHHGRPSRDLQTGLPAGDNTFLHLKGLHDLTIVADGVRLVCTYRTRAITFDHCSNVTLQGVTVDYDPLPFTQGDIVAIANDKSSIDVKIHAGYPAVANSRIDIVDPKTRFRKRGMPFLWGTKAELIAPDVVRVSLKDIGYAAAVGDMASLSGWVDPGGIPHAIGVETCSHMTLKNVTVCASPSMGIIESDGDGGSYYDGCRVVPGPPPGRHAGRLLSTNHDAMQSVYVKNGPMVENCDIERAGDNSWSVQSSSYLVIDPQGTSVVLGYTDGWTDGPQVGERITTGLDGATAAIVDRQFVPAQPDWPKAPKYLHVDLDHDVGLTVGNHVFDVDRMGNGFVFRHNHTHSSGRVLIKAGGLVEDNVLDTPHALDVCPETAGDGDIRNLTIRSNTIVASGYFCPAHWSTQAGAVSVSAGGKWPNFQTVPGFDHIVIENNTFKEIDGPNIVVASARNVTIAGNRFINPQHVPPTMTGDDYKVDHGSVVFIAQSSNVTLRDNTIVDPGPYLTVPLSLGPGATGVSGTLARPAPR